MLNCVGPYLGYSCYYTGRHGNIDDTYRQQLVVCQMLRDTGQGTRTSENILFSIAICGFFQYSFLVSPTQFKHQIRGKKYMTLYVTIILW